VGWIVLGVLALVGVLLIGWLVGLYNGLVRRRNPELRANTNFLQLQAERGPVRVRF